MMLLPPAHGAPPVTFKTIKEFDNGSVTDP